MALPPPIRGYRSKVINALLRECRANTPLPGLGTDVRRTPLGTVINAEPGGEGEANVPAAWSVREAAPVKDEETGEETQKWEIFSPVAVVGQEKITPDEMVDFDWNPLDDTLCGGSKTLYAVVRAAKQPNDVGGNYGDAVTATVSLANMPEPGGSRCNIPIGKWRVDTGTGKAVWTQNHVGVLHFFDPDDLILQSLVLGPLELFTEGDGETTLRTWYAQFLGTFTVDGTNINFVHAVAEDGSPLPPVVKYPARKIVYRVTRDTGSSSTQTGIAYKQGPDFETYGEPDFWLGLNNVTVATPMAYEAPADETEEGAITAGSVSLTFLGEESTDPTRTALLYTVVEDANEAMTYEASMGLGTGDGDGSGGDA